MAKTKKSTLSTPKETKSDDKETLVFLPGMLNTETLWQHQQNALEDYFNIFHADTYNSDNFSTMAENILSSTTGKLTVVGLSMGGYCALELLHIGADRIKQIALLNTGARESTPENKLVRRRLIQQSKTGRFIGVSNKMLDLMLGEKSRENEELRSLIVHMAFENGREVYTRQQTAIINRKPRLATLKGVKIPILCVAGQQDTVTPPIYLKEIVDATENSTYVEIEKCGHLSPLEFPSQVTNILKEWLKIK